MRHGKGFTKAEKKALLKAIEQILPIDAEAWNEVHIVFNRKHSPHGVEGLKCKFNKLANKPVLMGNPNIPEDVRLTKSIKSKLFCHSGATNLSEEEEEEEDIEEEVDDDNKMETVDENLPSQPIITDTEVQEILNNEEDENNSTIAVEVSEEVTDTQAAMIAAPESSPTTTVQHGTQIPVWRTCWFASDDCAAVIASHKKQRMDTSQNESGMGDMLEIMKMDMMSQMQQ